MPDAEVADASGRATSLSLFVYYQLPQSEQAQARQEIEAAQQRLSAALPHLTAELMQRADVSGDVGRDTATWMEVYRCPGGLTPSQLALIRAEMADLPSRRTGPRHDEVFAPLTRR